MRNVLANLSAIVFCSALAALVIAQDASQKKPGNVPADSKFALQIDLNAIKGTQLGAMLFSVAKQKAIEEIHKQSGEDVGLARIKEMVGLDPFEDVQSISLSSSDYDSPEKSMLAIVRLKKTAGNLEGMVLGLPEYAATPYKKHQIHSAAPDKKMRVYGAFHGTGDQDRVMVVCPNQSTVQAVLDQLDSGSQVVASTESIPLIRLHVFDIPQDKIGKGPQANVAKIVKSVMLDVQGKQESIEVSATMLTETEKQADQLQQMASGLMAMIDFAQSMDSSDKDLKKLRELVTGHETKLNGSSVQVTVRLKADAIANMIAESAHLDLPQDAVKLAERKRLDDAKIQLEAKRKQLEALKKESEAELKSIEKELERLK